MKPALTPEEWEAPRHPMEEVERRMNIRPLHELHAERDVLVDQVAGLEARYGFRTWDAHRKQVLSVCELKVRDAALDTGGARLTDALASAKAHADPVYIAYLSQQVVDTAALVRLRNRIQNLNEEANRGQAVGKFRTAEVMMAG